jgi:hypothetical protein
MDRRTEASMSLARFAKKRDAVEPFIVNALEEAGWLVWRLDRPCDLLCFKAAKGFRPLEVKTGRGKSLRVIKDKRQKEQTDFLILTGTPIVRTPEEALRALGEIT